MMRPLFTFGVGILLIVIPFTMAQGEFVSPETVPGAITIDGPKAKELFEKGVTFVDVRRDKDWEAGRIPEAVHLELKKEFTKEALSKVVQKDEEVVIYCNGVRCPRSSTACAKAVEWGFTKVYYYRLGFPDWQSRGYPIE